MEMFFFLFSFQMEHFIDHLQQSTISNQIFPQIANGFSDTVPLVREQTIKVRNINGYAS